MSHPAASLTPEQRRKLETECTHPVVVCCADYTFPALAIELLDHGTLRCPLCAVEVTSLLLEHIAACRNFGGPGEAPGTRNPWH